MIGKSHFTENSFHQVGTVRRNLNDILHHQRIECGVQHRSYAGDLRAWPLPRVPVSFMCVPLRAEDNTGSERDCAHPRLSSWALHAEERWRSTASGSDSCGSGQAVKSPQQETKRAVTPQLCYYHGVMGSYLSSLKYYYIIISFWVFILL